MKKNVRGFHAVVESIDLAREVLAGGARIIQFRHKTASDRDFLLTARFLRKTTRESRALLIINDRADIAYCVGADGVHLGQDDLPLREARRIVGKGCLVGASTHSREEAEAAVEQGADYIGFGPVFKTSSKDMPLDPRGLDALRDAASRISIPVIAIGGIREDNLRLVLEAGARGAAMISELADAGDVAQKTRAILRIFART